MGGEGYGGEKIFDVGVNEKRSIAFYWEIQREQSRKYASGVLPRSPRDPTRIGTIRGFRDYATGLFTGTNGGGGLLPITGRPAFGDGKRNLRN